MFVVVTPLALVFVRSRPPEVSAEAPPSAAATAAASPHRDPFADVLGLEVAEALRARSFWMIVAAQFPFPLAGVGAFVHMVAYLSGIGYGDAAAALSLSLVLLIATLGQPLMGVVADRIGGRRALARAFGLLALSLMLLLAATQMAALAMFVLVFGLIVARPIVLSPLVVAESLGVKRYGSLMGLVGFTFTLGLALGPLLAGAIYDFTASYARAFVVASLACVPAEWERIPTPIIGATPCACSKLKPGCIDDASRPESAPQR
jgi:MFS family permease